MSAAPAETLPAAVAGPTGFPRIGIAHNWEGAWCAEFPPDSLAAPFTAGERITLVAADSANLASAPARIIRRRTEQCPAAFPQPRWFDYVAYDMALIDSSPGSRQGLPTVVLVAAGDVAWTRDANGYVRADLDRDGSIDEARSCAQHEGVHYAIWTQAPDGTWRRRAHEYFDWGALVEPTCKPGESVESDP